MLTFNISTLVYKNCPLNQDSSTVFQNVFGSISVSRNNGVPPAPPGDLAVTSVTKSSVTLSWLPSKIDGGSPVTAYRLNYHRQFGDWDRVDVPANLSIYILQNMRCGTVYQFFMEAINDFGIGERTETVVLNTQVQTIIFDRARSTSYG